MLLGRLADEASLSVVHLALGFVVRHPAVTSAIIGPRTMAQLESQLGAVDVTLDQTVVDQIDQIVPFGKNLNNDEVGWGPAALAAPSARKPHLSSEGCGSTDNVVRAPRNQAPRPVLSGRVQPGPFEIRSRCPGGSMPQRQHCSNRQ